MIHTQASKCAVNGNMHKKKKNHFFSGSIWKYSEIQINEAAELYFFNLVRRNSFISLRILVTRPIRARRMALVPPPFVKM